MFVLALDEGVGQIVASLDAAGVLEDTIIVLTSDNGPWWQGDPSALRGRKGKTWEGGMRVPFIIHWPGGLGSGEENDSMAMGIDLFPTFAQLLEIELPQDRVIDGRPLWGMLQGKEGTPHDQLYYFAGDDVIALREESEKEGRYIYCCVSSVRTTHLTHPR